MILSDLKALMDWYKEWSATQEMTKRDADTLAVLIAIHSLTGGSRSVGDEALEQLGLSKMQIFRATESDYIDVDYTLDGHGYLLTRDGIRYVEAVLDERKPQSR